MFKSIFKSQNKSGFSDGRLEKFFSEFRKNTIGHDFEFDTPYGKKKLLYADWIASGRLYAPIEDKMLHEFGPIIANTHTETSFTGAVMTHAYHKAKEYIKQQVNAGENDALIATGTGMTGAIVKFQRILGLKIADKFKNSIQWEETDKPVVFITHMEHHSNHTSWLETLAEVEIIQPDSQGQVDLEHLKELLQKYATRKTKIASISAASNVTGVKTPFYDIAEIMHQNGGLCFVDFACSGPYVHIDMHPKQRPLAKLDAIFLSPHKFLGGPGTSGLVIFDKALYTSQTPDCPGGGTVVWTNPWDRHLYLDDIETREDGGTPGFLQLIRVAQAFSLKKKMGVTNIEEREKEIIQYIFKSLTPISNVKILADNLIDRVGAISFLIQDAHFNLVVRLLSDKYGIQVRGGCSCAGTYGHYLLQIAKETSRELMGKILGGDIQNRPGWIRLSIHPTHTDAEVETMVQAITDIAANHQEYIKEYTYNSQSNTFSHISQKEDTELALAIRCLDLED